jgi:glycerophosphoryl diester phosphodiesterase
MAAFRRAHEEGATWFECDVKLTEDGVPILMHDDTLERTTDGKGNVAEASWAEIEKLDAGGPFSPAFRGERVPHLRDVLRFAVARHMHINLEIKPCEGRARATTIVALTTATQIWPQDRPPPLISSFNEEALAIAAQLHPDWPRSFAFEEWREDWRATAALVGAKALTVDTEVLTPERMRVLTSSGLVILPYTVNDPARAKELLKQGARAVFSDNPREIIGAL